MSAKNDKQGWNISELFDRFRDTADQINEQTLKTAEDALKKNLEQAQILQAQLEKKEIPVPLTLEKLKEIMAKPKGYDRKITEHLYAFGDWDAFVSCWNEAHAHPDNTALMFYLTMKEGTRLANLTEVQRAQIVRMEDTIMKLQEGKSS